MASLLESANKDEACLAAAKADPNLAECSTLDELHAKLKELSLALTASDAADSSFAAIKFEGTNPNPVFTPNTYMPKKGSDGNAITTYYRYAVKEEAHAEKASGVKKAGFAKASGGAAAAPAAAAAAPAKRPSTFGGKKMSVTQMIDLIKTRDPAMGDTADFSGQATFQMDSDGKMKELCDAIAGDGSACTITTLILKDCGVLNEGAATLGKCLATNSSITNLDLSGNGTIKDEGGAALAAGLATNKALLELNLMGLGGGIAIRSEVICAAFIKAFETNVTLKKPIWRLDHPLAHTLARLVTRNTSIARCISQGKGFEALLPDGLKGTGVVVLGAPAAGP